jgi:formiminotetrahydrofolate cyclodeaminase
MSDLTDPVAEQTLAGFGEALASGQPTPGGGAAAAVAAALGTNLTAMVVRLSLDRPRYAEHAALHQEVLAASDAARTRFLELADQDAAAYAAYMVARSLPHATEAEDSAREAATRTAARQAASVPLDVVKACQAQIELVDRVAGRTNLNVASDLEVAVLMLEAAARSAGINVRANLGSTGDAGYASAVAAELDQRLQLIGSSADRARERVSKGVLRRPEGS